MIISLDTETTGVDLAHGAMPFLVTTWDGENPIRYWEWLVNPLTRIPEVPQEDIESIIELVDAADLIYTHNCKFDYRALLTVGIELPWGKVRDSLIMAHLLASNHRHDLTSCCVEYLGVDIEPHELLIKQVTQQCRTIAKRDFPHWKLADEGVPGLPSVKASTQRDEDKPWKNDMWLPAALVKELGKVNPFRLHAASDVPNKTWAEACAKYANADSEHTLLLGKEMERIIRQRGLWKVYEHRLQLPRADCEMELYGVTAIGDDVRCMADDYERHGVELEAELVSIAADYGHKLELAEGASINDNMRDFFYGTKHHHCPRCGYSKRIKHWNGEKEPASGQCTKCAGRKRRPAHIEMVLHERANLAMKVLTNGDGNATLNADAMKEYLTTLDDGPALQFVELLADKRMYGTALSYINAYQRFWVPVTGCEGYFRVHSSINPCATDHLRQSSNSPNMQNVSGESKELSNRACFGPLPDREWWAMDYKSIENRLPAYESGEEKMIELFERPRDPPFFGSYYLLNASITCPDLFWPLADREGVFKREQPGPYKRVKFGTLAMQYGCGKAKADKLYRMRGAYDLLKSALPKLTALQHHYVRFAERNGYVETIPSRAIDPERGYPILASRTEEGRVLSTTPFNYHVSGTACECKNLALIRCADQCRRWQAEWFDAHVALEVHDELLFDFPRGAAPQANLERAMVLKGLMEQSGEDLVPRIPTPVSVTYHARTWAEGETIC